MIASMLQLNLFFSIEELIKEKKQVEVKVPPDSLLYVGCFWQYEWRSCRGH